ncbi:MAG: hypothetical protein RLY16_734 [Bacteroidota bacterium]
MAKAIHKSSIKQLEKMPYSIAREQLSTGDIVFCSGNYLFSGIIRKLTNSVWSHVAVVYKDEQLGRVLLMEAEPSVGIRLIPLSNYLKNYHGTNRPYKGNLVVCKITDLNEGLSIGDGISFGLDALTKPYDNWEIFRIMIRILFKISKRERNRSYICSELVRDILAKSGLRISYQDTYISPDHIYTNKHLTLHCRLL